ncbi:unnamed protein product [Arctogadus glacialis]
MTSQALPDDIRENLNQNLNQNINQNLTQNLNQNLNQNLTQNLNQNLTQNLNQNLNQNLWISRTLKTSAPSHSQPRGLLCSLKPLDGWTSQGPSRTSQGPGLDQPGARRGRGTYAVCQPPGPSPQPATDWSQRPGACWEQSRTPTGPLGSNALLTGDHRDLSDVPPQASGDQ